MAKKRKLKTDAEYFAIGMLLGYDYDPLYHMMHKQRANPIMGYSSGMYFNPDTLEEITAKEAWAHRGGWRQPK